MPKKLSKTNYIFITGGVISSLGKGISSASLGLLLQSRGYTVTVIKLDPYINVDPGTMSPLQHGEVFVTDDGAETDLDLGHYERFLGKSLTRDNNHTTGQVYYEVITKERQGKYLGKTVQVIPHITDEIKKRMLAFDDEFDFVIIEIGGTVGDIESLPFLEAQRQLNMEPKHKTLNIHLTYVPYIKAAGEIKTKPTQHSVKTLMEYGIKPDILLCRTEYKLSKDVRAKIALFCMVDVDCVFEVLDAEKTIYEIPLMFSKNGLPDRILTKMGMEIRESDLNKWEKFVDKIKRPKHSVTIALVGKYTNLGDAYKSIIEAFVHAGSINDSKVVIKLVNSEKIEDGNAAEHLAEFDGILIGPGFGDRGIEGKIKAAQYARENNVPFFGICLGMQCAVIEYSRNICGLADANSTEFVETPNNVIDFMDEQRKITDKGGTMRLGSYPCVIKPGTKAYEAYGNGYISERHRHRYEVNNDYRDLLQDNGMILSGMSPDRKLVEMMELPNHPWFVGVQFHPELKSRAVTGHPLFIKFIKAALNYRLKKDKVK
ncbi:MAG: CTP synthase [bacterium]